MTERMEVRPKSTEDLEHENRVERLKLLDAIVRGLEAIQAAGWHTTAKPCAV
jgi:hypothetical protein